MSSFTKGAWWPTGRTVNGRAELCITTPFTFYVSFPSKRWAVDVPEGFVFDGASIPHWSRYFLPVGSMEVPSAVHDYLRRDHEVPLWLGDLVFLQAMIAYGMPKTLAFLAYLAVVGNKNRY